jgi:starvation-inducible DNA-binding protein
MRTIIPVRYGKPSNKVFPKAIHPDEGDDRRHFRDYHLLLDEHGDQPFAMTDPIAERVRKIGGLTIKSIGQIARLQRVLDNDAEYVEPLDMVAELADDNGTLAARLREAHNVCDEHRDVATASLIENWIDETERRTWFLSEITRRIAINPNKKRIR